MVAARLAAHAHQLTNVPVVVFDVVLQPSPFFYFLDFALRRVRPTGLPLQLRLRRCLL